MLYEHEMVRKGLAFWHNGRLIPIMRGGSGDEPLFSLPQEGPVDKWDLTEIEDGDLAALAAGLRERVAEVLAGRADPDVVGERTRTEVAEEMQNAVLAIETIDKEIEDRAADLSNYDSTLDELASKAGVKNETPDEGEATEETEETNPEPDEEEATVAAAMAVPATKPRPLPAARAHRPTPVEHDDGLGLRVTPFAAGLGSPFLSQDRLDRRGVGEFMDDVINKSRIQPGQKVVMAHARHDFPKERMLSEGPDGYLVNADKVRNVMGAQALTASGDLCAPLPPRYELPGVETAVRPVRAALESFMAARGGVQVGVTPKLADYEDAVGVVTAAENAEGGTFAVKNCMRIECPDFNPVKVDSIYTCYEADNLAAKSYPELMSRIADLVMANQARVADSKLLQAIKEGSTNVTGGGTALGATFSIFGDIFKLAAGIRSRNRMPAGSLLQALIPEWFLDALQLDGYRAVNVDGRDTTRAGAEALLRRAGIIPYFYLDGPSTGDGQIFATQTAGAILDFPDHIQYCIYPAGSWLHLDSGELNLGVVRDSTLNATNDYQVFAETWENVAFTGVESDWVTSTFCANGTFAAGVDAHTVCS
jgi:hypothetical protein